jgi:hypothetical protein
MKIRRLLGEVVTTKTNRAGAVTSVAGYVCRFGLVYFLLVPDCFFSNLDMIFQCGVPKKGHICPYQPKLKRRTDEPPPLLRNAAVQVEMDEV